MLVLDASDRITLVNPACEAMLNQSQRALSGQRLDMVMEPPAGYRERRPELGFAAYDCEIRLRRGTRMHVDFIEAMIPERPGWRIVTLHHAPAGRRHSHGLDRGAGARAAIGAAAMLAHEIKNPLSGIRGAAQLLRDGVDDPEPMSELIIAEVDRIAALIDRMEGFTDTRPLQIEQSSIYPLLNRARQIAEAGFCRNIPIEERYDPSLPQVMINADAFLQILVNLLKNASEALAGQDDPKVAIVTSYRHGMSISTGPGHPRRPLPIEIAIIDNGPGAPEDIAPHLFEPFISGKPEGTGLGLPLVDKLMRDMGGLVQYAREEIDGTAVSIFRLHLPTGNA